MKKHFIFSILMILFASTNAQSDTFGNTRNLWKISVRNKTGFLYDYKVQKIATNRYEWEFCENVWERYEDSAWQIFVDYEAQVVYVDRIAPVGKKQKSEGMIRLADSVWDYLEEVKIPVEKLLVQDTGTSETLSYTDPACRYAFEETSVEVVLNEEELRIKQNCLLERFTLTPDEKKGRLNDFIFVTSKDIILNKRFQNFEFIENW